MAKKNVNAAPAIQLYTTVKAMDTAIIAMHKSGQDLQAEMHKLACSVLKHCGQHKDIRMVSKLLDAMPEAARVNALRAWFEKFGNVSFDGNEPVLDGTKKVLVGEAMATPFWKFKPEAAYVPMDLEKELNSFIKKIETDAKKTGRDHGVMVQALRNDLAAIRNNVPAAAVN